MAQEMLRVLTRSRNFSTKVRNSNRPYGIGSQTHPNSDNIRADIARYPPRKINTILNICPQGYNMVIETVGKFSRMQGPGLFFCVPFFQKINYVIDDRELVVDVHRQFAYTLDNVQIAIAAQLYITITNPYKTCYNVRQPLLAIISHAQSAMRTSVGRNDLDHLLKDRKSINRDVDEALHKTEDCWGIKINRVEITELVPDAKIADAMDLQATAERERRQTEKNAEAKKRAMELEAEGYRNKVILEAEGDKQRAILTADGKAEALRIETDAQASTIEKLARSGKLSEETVLSFQTTLRYIESLTNVANNGKHTTFFVNKDISDVNVMTKSILPLIHNKSL